MKTLIIGLLLFISVPCFAQEKLNNESVVALLASGLSTEIVVAKIKASDGEFDTSTPTLLKLGEAKTPEPIVLAMIEKESERQSRVKAATAKNNDALGTYSEQGTLADIKGLTRVFINTDNMKARDIIAKELQKAGLVVADALEAADIKITYTQFTEDVSAVVTRTENSAQARMNTQEVGNFSVAMRGKAENIVRDRNVYATRKTKYWMFEDHPAKSAVKQFLKDWRKG